MGLLPVLDADWSFVTKYREVFDLMNINELSLSVTATVGRPLICCEDTDQLLTSDICCHKDFFFIIWNKNVC